MNNEGDSIQRAKNLELNKTNKRKYKLVTIVSNYKRIPKERRGNMGMIRCPECGKSISDKAKVCPSCGYQGDDAEKPISQQIDFEIIPHFQFEIEDKQGNIIMDRFELTNQDDNMALYKEYGTFDGLLRNLPSLAEIMKEAKKMNNIRLEADMNAYIRSKINSGDYYIARDKNGQLLPQLRGLKEGERHITDTLRLKEAHEIPQLNTALSNIAMQATMHQILNELGYLQHQIAGLFQEFQNDRFAMIQSAEIQFQRALEMKDLNLKQNAILIAINEATTGQKKLEQHFLNNVQTLIMYKNLKRKDKKDIDTKRISEEIFTDMQNIIQAIKIEYKCYMYLGETQSAKHCLISFKEFVTRNGLNQKDMWLMFNEYAPNDQRVFVNSISDIVEQLEYIENTSNRIGNNQTVLIDMKDESGDEDNE